MTKLKIASVLALLAGPAFADGHAAETLMGDAEAGEKLFARQCISCHIVANADGEVLAGRNAKTGPNLFAIAGRVIGSADGYRYSQSLIGVGEAGGTWDEAGFMAFVQSPTDYVRAELDDSRARSKMSFKVRSEDDAANLYAYMATFAAAAE